MAAARIINQGVADFRNFGEIGETKINEAAVAGKREIDAPGAANAGVTVNSSNNKSDKINLIL